ncbi:MAG: LppX_LprAFG lipoprotein [Anaerolineae bacterium]|nr:LppX_LprAFG lipoprotein [Anaerolineae bacterium]
MWTNFLCLGKLRRMTVHGSRFTDYGLRFTVHGLRFTGYGFWLLTAVLLLLTLTACRSTNLPELPPAEIVQNAADRMNAMAGFRFDISREGAPAYLDPDNILSFRRAAGAYVAPDKAAATVRVIGPGLITDVNVVSIAETQWQTNVATGQWEELPPNWGFNPAVLFDPAVGLPTILTNDVSNLQLGEPQKLPGGSSDQLLYYLTGDVAGERLYTMSGTLIGPQAVTVAMWIRPETFELVRVVVTEPEPAAGEPSIWQVDFANYGEVVDIQPPIVE